MDAGRAEIVCSNRDISNSKSRKSRILLTSQVEGRSSEDDKGAGSTSAIHSLIEDSAKASDEPKWGRQWNRVTERLTDCSTFVFVLLLMPQIIKNTRNLLNDNASALSIIPWMGYTCSLIGNMLLLSYFASKKERAASTVQAIGVLSNLVMLFQVYLAGFIPPLVFAVAALIGILALAINYMTFQGSCPRKLARSWHELTGVIGITALPQVAWSLLTPYASLLPGILAFGLGVVLVILDISNKLPRWLKDVWCTLGAWIATLLFMVMPVAQLIKNCTQPDSLEGIAIGSVLLGALGNGLMIPRALFLRDVIWLTGSSWGTILHGWGVMCSMYIYNFLNAYFFAGITLVLFSYLAAVAFSDLRANGKQSLRNPDILLV